MVDVGKREDRMLEKIRELMQARDLAFELAEALEIENAELRRQLMHPHRESINVAIPRFIDA